MNTLLPESTIASIAETYGPGTDGAASFVGDYMWVGWQPASGARRMVHLPIREAQLSEHAFRTKFVDAVADKYYGHEKPAHPPELTRAELIAIVRALVKPEVEGQ